MSHPRRLSKEQIAQAERSPAIQATKRDEPPKRNLIHLCPNTQEARDNAARWMEFVTRNNVSLKKDVSIKVEAPAPEIKPSNTGIYHYLSSAFSSIFWSSAPAPASSDQSKNTQKDNATPSLK